MQREESADNLLLPFLRRSRGVPEQFATKFCADFSFAKSLHEPPIFARFMRVPWIEELGQIGWMSEVVVCDISTVAAETPA